MKQYYINNIAESRYSFTKYTFEEVKEFFKRDPDEDIEHLDDNCYTIEQENKMIDDCKDIEELIDVLTELECGMAFSYEIEEC